MSTYRAPMQEMQFVMNELAGLEQVGKLPGYEDATPDTVTAILEEASKFATEVLDPLNAIGDREGATWQEGGKVRTATGFKDAYRRFAENGWNGLTKNPEHGGQGLPQLVATAVEEMWHSANMAFALCPLLTQGAIEALELCGSDELKATFLPKMVEGVWTGTMNLTEPQAGSDLAAVRTRAVPSDKSGAYKLYGQKIFITYGEQDYTDNIIHLVLARTPTAPEGVKGISLFLVPKFMVNDDGSLGARNDVHCVSIEHKLGIHASPTAVLAYGDQGGAVGYLVGEENRGLEYMFIMMNLARFSVGIEGVGIAERSYQRAREYARDRVQGRAPGLDKTVPTATILQHPDVRRMLLTMKAQTEATRALAYVTGAAIDNARRHPDADARKRHQAFVELMIPIVKGWGTEIAQEVTYLGVQVHGGMGFIEETGAAQDYRDARITTIYEGTTAIQANDLIGRKTARDGGVVARSVIGEIVGLATALSADANGALVPIGNELQSAAAALKSAVDWVVPTYGKASRAAHAASVPYLRLWGLVAGGWQLARGAQVAARLLAENKGDASFYRGKVATARFYAECLLPQAAALARAITLGSESVLALSDEQF
ncbi:MAG: acyl-CoA dehydrogenase [Betaproteobacteria bacterium]|nr:MAG: acyl-CoA dehydrogenase [Betaproteobacteria bacterium]